jgi:hypothetical protein
VPVRYPAPALAAAAVRSLPRPQIKAAEAKEAAKNKPAEPKASVAKKTTPSTPTASTPRATTGGKTMGAKGRAGESQGGCLRQGVPCAGTPTRGAPVPCWGGRTADHRYRSIPAPHSLWKSTGGYDGVPRVRDGQGAGAWRAPARGRQCACPAKRCAGRSGRSGSFCLVPAKLHARLIRLAFSAAGGKNPNPKP